MRAIYIIPAVVVALALALSSVFIVDEREKALVLQFGQVTQVIDRAGPWLQDAVHPGSRAL